jgi:predicted TIM-barrel fold metal-dependent hydrolase
MKEEGKSAGRSALSPPKIEIFDAHTHPGFEKKDIEKRSGFLEMWLGDTTASRIFMDIRAGLGDPEPYKVITKAEELPDFGVEDWIRIMDENNVTHCVLQCMNCVSDPPLNYKWQMPYEYVKEEFIDKYPGRFIGIGGVNCKLGAKEAVKQVEKAKEFGFKGIKIFTPYGPYPNDREKCYPVYEKCLELGLHVEIHTGTEETPGARAKYQDPVFIDDVAMDFSDLKILQLHCGFMNRREHALWNVITHPNVYTDVTWSNPKWLYYKYTNDLEHFRFLEAFMPDKVFYGTDFPINLSVYRSYIDHILQLPLTDEFKRKLMRDNARKFYLGDVE